MAEIIKPEEVKKEEVKVTLPFRPKSGTYKVLKDKMIVMANGQKMKKTLEGYYDPKTEEEKDLCIQFAAMEILEIVK